MPKTNLSLLTEHHQTLPKLIRTSLVTTTFTSPKTKMITPTLLIFSNTFMESIYVTPFTPNILERLLRRLYCYCSTQHMNLRSERSKLPTTRSTPLRTCHSISVTYCSLYHTYGCEYRKSLLNYTYGFVDSLERCAGGTLRFMT